MSIEDFAAHIVFVNSDGDLIHLDQYNLHPMSKLKLRLIFDSLIALLRGETLPLPVNFHDDNGAVFLRLQSHASWLDNSPPSV